MTRTSIFNQNLFLNVLYDIYSIIFIHIIGAYYLISQLIWKYKTPPEFPIKKGQIAIVTGGLQGIGYEIVKQLMKLEMRVIIAAPTSSNVKATLENLSKISSGTVEFKEMNLKSLKSVEKFANDFLDSGLPLHVLVNNAGVMFGKYLLTEDGFESQLGINYLGHLYLIHKLLPRLSETGTVSQRSRIVNVSSCCHYAGWINIDDMNSKNYYSSYGCYSQSKLMIIMTSMMLNKFFRERNLPVVVNSVHPGVVNTNLYQNTVLSKMPFVRRSFFLSPEEGARNVLYVALSDDLGSTGGQYFEYCEVVSPNRLAFNEEIQRELWRKSCELLHIDDFFCCDE